MIPRWSIAAVAVLTVVGLSALLMGLDLHFGFVPLELMFLEFKARLVRDSPERSLVSLGAVFPPLLVWMSALAGSAVLVQVALGAALVSRIWQRCCVVAAVGVTTASSKILWGDGFGARINPGVWAVIWMSLTLAHPAVGLMLLRAPIWILTALMLSYGIRVVLAIFRGVDLPTQGVLPPSPLWQPRELTLPLVMLGFTWALLTLVRWEFWFVMPVLVAAVMLSARGQKQGFQVTAVVILSFMSLALMAGWLYVNWLPSGDPFAFLHDHSSGVRLPQLQSYFQQYGWLEGLRRAGWGILVVTPAYGLVSIGALLHTRHKGAMLLVILAPVLMEMMAYQQGSFLPEISRYGLFVVIVPVLLQACVPHHFLSKVAVTAALGLSLFTGGFWLESGHVMPEEAVLWGHLSGQTIVAANPDDLTQRLDPRSNQPVQRWLEQRAAEREAGAFIVQTVGQEDVVLVDDAVHFPVLYWVANPYQFLTPQMQTFGYALAQPHRLVDYVLVSGFQSPVHRQDRVVQFRPQTLSNGNQMASLPQFKRAFSNRYIQILVNSQGKEAPTLRDVASQQPIT
jgi:hypothetical protein